MRLIFLLLLFIAPLKLLAVDSEKVTEAVESYYAQQSLWDVLQLKNNSFHRHLPGRYGDCEPNYPQACIEAICSRLRPLDCSFSSDLLEITRQCRNVKGSCITTVCNKVSRLDCDDKDDLFSVAEMCRGLYDVGCIDYVCSRISKLDCDDLEDLSAIANQCK
ncbi:MAG: hypothetical protein ACXVCL_17375 [Bdellovibrio sp.]